MTVHAGGDGLRARTLSVQASPRSWQGGEVFDVGVVLDLVLEDGNGLELLDRVRSSDGLASRLDPDLPVIVLTGR